MVQFLLKEYLRGIQEKGDMSRENMGIFTYFVNKGGTQFIPFGNLPEDDARLMQIVSAELGRDDPRSLSSGPLGHMVNNGDS